MARSDERRATIERLRRYETQINGILDHLRGDLPVGSSDKVAAQEALKALKALKANLNEDAKQGGASSHVAASDVEQAYFYPAIREAAATINVRWNSNPSRAWASELYDALTTITHSLGQLEAEDSTPGG